MVLSNLLRGVSVNRRLPTRLQNTEGHASVVRTGRQWFDTSPTALLANEGSALFQNAERRVFRDFFWKASPRQGTTENKRGEKAAFDEKSLKSELGRAPILRSEARN